MHPAEVVEEDDCRLSCLGRLTIEDAASRRSFLYRKLPSHLLRLSVLKLDGSAFDVLIEKNATVGKLKQAVEDVFISSPKEGHGQISWSHVWGHFCLSFHGQKLLNDRMNIREYGILDGDQLQFVRHLSVNYSPMRRRSKSQNHVIRQPEPSISGGTELEESSKDEEEEDHFEYYNVEDHEIPLPEFRFAHFLRRCLSSRPWGESRKVSGTQSRPSRFSIQWLGRGNRGYMAVEV